MCRNMPFAKDSINTRKNITYYISFSLSTDAREKNMYINIIYTMLFL